MTHPSERIKRAEELLGVELMPWQREFAEQFLAGEQMVTVGGRRSGWSTVRRVIQKACEDDD